MNPRPPLNAEGQEYTRRHGADDRITAAFRGQSMHTRARTTHGAHAGTGDEPLASATLIVRRLSSDHRTWLFVILACAVAVLMPGLGEGQFRPYDEGLYAKAAHNAIAYGTYVHAVDETGAFSSRFSKPPLTIWATVAAFKLFGTTLWALRLPFVLGMILVIGVGFGWGRRIGGLPLAVAWAAVLLLCTATTRWGRHACIEPLFVGFMLLALWSYHEAVVRTGRAALRWAAMAGLGLAAAFLTKQLAVGVAVIPIIVLELWRRDGARAWRRLTLTLTIPATVAAVWATLAYASSGPELFEALLARGVQRRLTGFSSDHNARALNEMTDILGEATHPFSWGLGVAGLAAMAAAALRSAKTRPEPTLLLPLMFGAAVVAYENAAAKMLPWYAFDLLPAVAGGAAWLLAGTVAPAQPVRAAIGWVTLALASLAALGELGSQLNGALLGGALVTWWLTTRLPQQPRVIGLLACAAVVTARLSRDREYTLASTPVAELMAPLHAVGVVAVHRATGLNKHYAHALFGPQAQLVRAAPWPKRAASVAAYVSPMILPREFVAPRGVTVIRRPGVTAVRGDLSAPVWDAHTPAELLRAGPITYEAELLRGTHRKTIATDEDASGGAVREYAQYRTEAPGRFPLSIGPELALASGPYVVRAQLRWSCATDDGVAAALEVRRADNTIASRQLACEASSTQLTEVTLPFVLISDARVMLRVVYARGRVAHDFTSIELAP